MYDNSYAADPSATVAMFGLGFWLVMIAAWIFSGFVLSRIAKKCGVHDEAWWAYIPILNLVLMVKMADRPIWWVILTLVPIVNLIVFFILWVEIAQNANHNAIWGVLAVLPFVNIIALMVMAFTGEPVRQPMRARSFSEQPRRTPQKVG